MVTNESDASILSNIGKENLLVLYNYAVKSLSRVQTRFAAIDSKASQTISLIAVVGGLLIFTVPTTKLKEIITICLLLSVIICFIIAILFCLWCLRVRSLLEAPLVTKTVNWINESEEKDIDIKLLSSLIIDIANAEFDHMEIYNKKARYLGIGQALEVVGIIFLLIFIGISKLQ